MTARVARAALAALAPGGAVLVVSARPHELLQRLRAAAAARSGSDGADSSCDGDAFGAALAAATVAPLNAAGAGVLILRAAAG